MHDDYTPLFKKLAAKTREGMRPYVEVADAIALLKSL